MHLLLSVWREACRHIDIQDSIERIAPLVAQRIPAELVVVRRFDFDRMRLETVAVGSGGPARELGGGQRTELSPAELQDVVAWCGERRVIVGELDGADPLLRLIAPQREGRSLAGPLMDQDRPIGVALFVAHAGTDLTEDHAATARALLDPLGVALANDSRLHELARLRETLEADRAALLTRLDRQDIVDSIVGSGSGLRSVMGRVEQVAPTDAPVLILGETGTGKEVIARAIHARSRRSRGPVVRVNCGAIPHGLMDSELFGHEKGSFTGAVSARQGWFERSDGGTLFMDEVAELPLEAQVRLLRILQDGSFERVGGSRTRTVDVRIVAATHRDLHQMVADGAFREDLWYRIGVFPIRIPPLRERLEDIPALAAHFALGAGKRLRGVPLAPSPADIELLVSYAWPGNVRELAAVMERAAILGDGYRLEVAGALGGAVRRGVELAAPVRGTATGPVRMQTGGRAHEETNAALPTLDAAMARHIEQALALTGGRIEGPRGAAAVLGINPHTLRARMRKLGVDWSRYRAPR